MNIDIRPEDTNAALGYLIEFYNGQPGRNAEMRAKFIEMRQACMDELHARALADNAPVTVVTARETLALSYIAVRAAEARDDDRQAWVDRLHGAVLQAMADQDRDDCPSCYGCKYCGLLYGH